MALTKDGTAKADDSVAAEKKAAKEAAEKAKDGLLVDAPDDSDYWKKISGTKTGAQLTITVEAPVSASGSASAKWKTSFEGATEKPGAPPAHPKGTFGNPDAVGAPSLCDGVLEKTGHTTGKFEKPCTRAKAFNKAIDEALKEVEKLTCANECPNKRIQIFVELDYVGGSGDDESYKMNWTLHMYCFKDSDEKP